MKKILFYFVFAASVFAFSSVSAQMANPEQQAKMKQMLKDSVQLSDAMADSVLAVHQQFQPQMKEIFTNQSLNDADRKSKLDALRMQMQTRYKSIGLTDDQIAKLDAMARRMRAQMRNPNGGGGQQ